MVNATAMCRQISDEIIRANHCGNSNKVKVSPYGGTVIYWLAHVMCTARKEELK